MDFIEANKLGTSQRRLFFHKGIKKTTNQIHSKIGADM